MGAVTFSLDVRLIECLKSALSLAVFVETGTFKGDAVADLLQSFERIVTVEFSETLWEEAVKRFKSEEKVKVLLGNSPEVLAKIRPTLSDLPTLFWLDAHWCVAENTAGLQSQCPLLEEIQSINKLDNNSVILIDDARLFLAPPLKPHEIGQWPSFDNIVTALRELNDQHELMVVNDVIAFYPSRARAAMESYAQSFGIDWLVAVNCLKENSTFVTQLEEKEIEIQQKEAAQQFVADSLQEKEDVIASLSDAMLELQAANSKLHAVIREQQDLIEGLQYVLRASALLRKGKQVVKLIPLVRPIVHVARRVVEIISPRLGNLNQYVPRPLTKQVPFVANLAAVAKPKISIVTPSYGQGGFIERTLKSVLDQQYPNLEYFVQDGGSKDTTTDVLAAYDKQLSGWRSEQDTGQSQAINRGFARTSGDIMAWLNSDDMLLPDALAVVTDFFNRHPEVDVVYGNRLLVDENDMEIGRWVMPGHDSDVLSWVDYVPQETVFWRRRIWDKVGGQIDESFRFAMDWDLLIRFRDAGARFGHIPRFLGAFRIHAHQKTSALINEIGHQEMNRLRERAFGRVPSRQEIRKAVFPFMLRHVTVDMVYRVKLRLRGK